MTNYDQFVFEGPADQPESRPVTGSDEQLEEKLRDVGKTLTESMGQVNIKYSKGRKTCSDHNPKIDQSTQSSPHSIQGFRLASSILQLVGYKSLVLAQ